MRKPVVSIMWGMAALMIGTVLLGGCGGGPTPTPVPPTMRLSLNPNITDIQTGQEVAIVPELEPSQAVTFRWSVEGSSGGTLNRETGPAAIYTAGGAGVDIVTVEAVGDDDAVLAAEVISFNVIAPTATATPTLTDTPTPTPTATPTDTPTPTLRPTDTPTATRTESPLPTDTPRPTPTDTPRPTRVPCEQYWSTRVPISAPPAEGWAEIVGPAHCTEVPGPPAMVETFGTYSPALEGQALWVLVYPPNRLYYPQRETSKLDDGTCQVAAAQARNGRWRVAVSLGREGVPEQFDIVLVMAEAGGEADEVFHDWLKTGCENSSFAGFSLTDLPPGLVELDAITVHTR